MNENAKLRGVRAAVAAVFGAGLLAASGAQALDRPQPIRMSSPEVLAAGTMTVRAGVAYEIDREAGAGQSYDNLRFHPLGLRFGLGSSAEVGGHLSFSSNSADDPGAPDDSGLEGLTFYGKQAINRSLALEVGMTLGGKDTVAPYPNGGLDFFVNVPMQRLVGDGLLYGEFGYRVLGDDLGGSYFNYGIGYAMPMNPGTTFNVELVGDEAPTAMGNHMDLVLGANMMLARNMRLGPYVSLGLYDASPNVAVGARFEIRP